MTSATNDTDFQLIELDPRRRTTVRVGHHSLYRVHELPNGTLIWEPAVVLTEDELALQSAPWLAERITRNRERTERTTRKLPD